MDPEDGDPSLLPRIHGISPERAHERLQPGEAEPPALAFWVAALREAFEETGILLCRRARREGGGSSNPARAKALARSRLLAGEISFKEVLETLDLSLDAGALEYNGHWITPECEPRRYETRFFTAEVQENARVTPHEKEMVDALWLTPEEALTRNRKGTLPLVFPTLFTLEELEPFQTPREALEYLGEEPVSRRLPKLKRTERGIGFSLAD